MKNNKVNIKGRNYEIIKVTGDLTNNGEKCSGVSNAIDKKIYIQIKRLIFRDNYSKNKRKDIIII